MTITWRSNPGKLEKTFGLWIDRTGHAPIGRESRFPTQKIDHDSWVRKGKAYMDAHFTEGIAVDHVADYLKVHRSYLTRKFTELYRVSPKQYLHRLRMEHADKLLRQTTMTIADIADLLHYSDAFSFSRAYKNYHCHAPSLTRCSSAR